MPMNKKDFDEKFPNGLLKADFNGDYFNKLTANLEIVLENLESENKKDTELYRHLEATKNAANFLFSYDPSNIVNIWNAEDIKEKEKKTAENLDKSLKALEDFSEYLQKDDNMELFVEYANKPNKYNKTVDLDNKMWMSNLLSQMYMEDLIKVEENKLQRHFNDTVENYNKEIKKEKEDVEKLKGLRNDLDAKHRISFIGGGTSDELQDVKDALDDYLLFKQKPDDPKFKANNDYKGMTDAEIEKALLTRLNNVTQDYEDIKQREATGKTGDPDYKPKTQMGQTRYGANKGIKEFAQAELQMIQKKIEREKALEQKLTEPKKDEEFDLEAKGGVNGLGAEDPKVDEEEIEFAPPKEEVKDLNDDELDYSNELGEEPKVEELEDIQKYEDKGLTIADAFNSAKEVAMQEPTKENLEMLVSLYEYGKAHPGENYNSQIHEGYRQSIDQETMSQLTLKFDKDGLKRAVDEIDKFCPTYDMQLEYNLKKREAESVQQKDETFYNEALPFEEEKAQFVDFAAEIYLKNNYKVTVEEHIAKNPGLSEPEKQMLRGSKPDEYVNATKDQVINHPAFKEFVDTITDENRLWQLKDMAAANEGAGLYDYLKTGKFREKEEKIIKAGNDGFTRDVFKEQSVKNGWDKNDLGTLDALYDFYEAVVDRDDAIEVGMANEVLNGVMSKGDYAEKKAYALESAKGLAENLDLTDIAEKLDQPKNEIKAPEENLSVEQPAEAVPDTTYAGYIKEQQELVNDNMSRTALIETLANITAAQNEGAKNEYGVIEHDEKVQELMNSEAFQKLTGMMIADELREACASPEKFAKQVAEYDPAAEQKAREEAKQKVEREKRASEMKELAEQFKSQNKKARETISINQDFINEAMGGNPDLDEAKGLVKECAAELLAAKLYNENSKPEVLLNIKEQKGDEAFEQALEQLDDHEKAIEKYKNDLLEGKTEDGKAFQAMFSNILSQNDLRVVASEATTQHGGRLLEHLNFVKNNRILQEIAQMNNERQQQMQNANQKPQTGMQK